RVDRYEGELILTGAARESRIMSLVDSARLSLRATVIEILDRMISDEEKAEDSAADLASSPAPASPPPPAAAFVAASAATPASGMPGPNDKNAPTASGYFSPEEFAVRHAVCVAIQQVLPLIGSENPITSLDAPAADDSKANGGSETIPPPAAP